ncbi:hypothetical protein [Sulfitobacter sp. 1A15299]|uniref:hypothetical protein n=1 Tax=Sulfitobacter sp. 1A15299 TaxID=3368598 RepID=UPI0037469A65
MLSQHLQLPADGGSGPTADARPGILAFQRFRDGERISEPDGEVAHNPLNLRVVEHR